MTEQINVVLNGSDFSATYWDNKMLLMNWTGKKGTNPPYTLADVIYNLNPNTKVIFLLRHPVERIYSEYLYFRKKEKKSADDFHAKIKAAIQRHWFCLKKHCLRYCSYFYVNEGIRLEVSIYHVYIEDYLRVFSRSQVKIVKTDNFSTNMKTVLTDVFRFLDIEIPSEETLTTICSFGKKNTNIKKYEMTGRMLPATNLLLSDFYKTHNEKLRLLLRENIDFD
ncbi:carbohydrate sulfotransferase 15-like [Ruditapes philippinarum]|uniref:carbohydrate sulfotransferase 15-like n=1 Tax=Ruditapes philippinarum TaxID=129788 RepID=UPI00295B4D49|nr:carbohydrate sulfotransferase 15-like [Ruditapes philippinarum]